MADDCIFCKIVAGELPVRDRPGGRAHRRLHGHQPVDARPRARDPAQPLDATSTRSREEDLAPRRPPRPSGWRCAMRDAPRLRRREPAQLVRAGRLADGLPLPHPRDPALRGRPAAPAGASRSRRTPERPRGQWLAAAARTAAGRWRLYGLLLPPPSPGSVSRCCRTGLAGVVELHARCVRDSRSTEQARRKGQVLTCLPEPSSGSTTRRASASSRPMTATATSSSTTPASTARASSRSPRTPRSSTRRRPATRVPRR